MWFPVAGAKELALKQVIQLPKPLWREVLELCGGELAEISAKAYREQETGLASSEVEIDVDEA